MATGKPIVLTRLEARVMQGVWDAGGAVTVREAAESLNAGRKGRDRLAYTTVQSMLNILRDKGALESARGPGRAHLYSAKVSREQASRHMLKDLAERLFSGEVEPLLVHLLDETDLDEAELKRLRAWVDKRLEGRA
jgi:BlaI family transcriptional regulator, penicillinase repressor